MQCVTRTRVAVVFPSINKDVCASPPYASDNDRVESTCSNYCTCNRGLRMCAAILPTGSSRCSPAARSSGRNCSARTRRPRHLSEGARCKSSRPRPSRVDASAHEQPQRYPQVAWLRQLEPGEILQDIDTHVLERYLCDASAQFTVPPCSHIQAIGTSATSHCPFRKVKM